MITSFSSANRFEREKAIIDTKHLLKLSKDPHHQHTPFELCEEMLSKAEENGAKLAGDVLVVANIEFVWLLSKYLKDLSRVYFSTPCPYKKRIAIRLGLKEENIYGPLLETEIMRQFDFIVGNPPYQGAKGSSGQKLWNKIYHKAFNLLKSDGYISFLTPSVFLLRNNKLMEKIRKDFNERDIVEINFAANNYFSVGENIVNTLVKNSKTGILTSVILANGAKSIQNLQELCFPSLGVEHDLQMSIFLKLDKSSLSKSGEFLKEDIHDCQNVKVKQGILSEIQSDEYPYPVVYTPKTTHYSKELFGDKDNLRLMLTIAGAWYVPKNPDRNIFITRAHSGQGMVHFLIESEEEGKNIKSFLISKLYRFFIEKEKTSGYNTGIGKLPMLDSTKSWTDNEVYIHFNLTVKEIELIEREIK
jgi:hypothetical protein